MRSENLTLAVLAIFRANGRLIAWGDRFAAPLGLTSARWQMLGAIALAPGPPTAPAIALSMGVSRQGAQKQLDLLLEDGLIESVANPAHARSPLYQLTARGRSLYARIDKRWREWASRAASQLEAREIEAAHRFLATLEERLAADLEAP